MKNDQIIEKIQKMKKQAPIKRVVEVRVPQEVGEL